MALNTTVNQRYHLRNRSERWSDFSEASERQILSLGFVFFFRTLKS